MTTTSTDKPKTPAQRAKFHLEFMQLMMLTGRDDEAIEALKQAHTALDEIIASEEIVYCPNCGSDETEQNVENDTMRCGMCGLNWTWESNNG